MLLQAVLDGAGATRLTSRITALTRWGICIPLSYALTYLLHCGATGIFVSMACAEATGTLCLLYLYRHLQYHCYRSLPVHTDDCTQYPGPI